VIEAIPNVSEGRRPEVVRALEQTLREISGLRLLDVTSDVDHHRSVFTWAGPAEVVEQAAIAFIDRSIGLIDLRRHRGVHPRIGAVDVLPLVPLAGATMAEAVELARRIGAIAGARFALPVFLYEAAATRPERRRLEDVRRGEFEGLAARLADPAWRPDFGPAAPHPTAGAIAIAARPPLVAFNVDLATDRVEVARRIAAVIRERNGGLPGVKALGLYLADRGVAQVSMNLTDIDRTPPAVAFAAVQREAARDGIAVATSELIGLIPQAALAGTSPEALQLANFDDDRILEVRLARTPANP
jgi:glutamate formiminotransferase